MFDMKLAELHKFRKHDFISRLKEEVNLNSSDSVSQKQLLLYEDRTLLNR
jgi:hypothetical protein